MNTSFLKNSSVIAVVGAALLAGCHHDRDRVVVVNPATTQTQTERTNTVVIHDAPPAPREEPMPSEPPPADKAWAPGHYEYENGNYTWVAGTWVTKPSPNAEYVAAHWENRDGGWVYVAGTWK